MLKTSASASLHEELGENPADLRALLKAETGQNFRRINRFIELALLGALRCRQQAGAIAPDTALYLACDSPMLADTVKILEGIENERRPPSPFEFMNVSGNMAGYYVAQQLGLNGPQLSLHRNRAGLEAALELLSLDSAQHRRALIGYVEEGVWPLSEQRARHGWTADAVLYECSHWFYFDQDCTAPLAIIETASAVSAEPVTQGMDTPLALSRYLAGNDSQPLRLGHSLVARKPPTAS
ncbi:MAG: hypothetical protein ACRETW_13490 [Stenotrophobium sp.]